MAHLYAPWNTGSPSSGAPPRPDLEFASVAVLFFRKRCPATVLDVYKRQLNTIANEGRKFGLALICASQSPTHFTDDFISSVGTKVILGIDEMYWRGAAAKMAVKPEALAWIKPRRSLLVQIKALSLIHI